uniref:Uncharacterized protein n=1 Tax=Vitrella brassicaformis TaxID=1169539 RepID=A0A7S1KG58_9ALVE|mmetsp:Transcript_51589/g.129603  ORF Transcript_51589/g.129603 Transcript_51589/m.129603 type:complete len:133 (+) Transcript_51589:588-986(+)
MCVGKYLIDRPVSCVFSSLPSVRKATREADRQAVSIVHNRRHVSQRSVCVCMGDSMRQTDTLSHPHPSPHTRQAGRQAGTEKYQSAACIVCRCTLSVYRHMWPHKKSNNGSTHISSNNSSPHIQRGGLTGCG